MTRIFTPALLGLSALGLLAACGTPQERCINRSTKEIRVLNGLLEEVNGNLARGYAWESYEVERQHFGICGYETHETKDGKKIRRPVHCWKEVTETLQRRVPIDPASETRKRDGLVAKIQSLEPQARANIAACKATYPEE
ncbi:hypothetical protein [Thioclava sp. GXIMD4216]|uniref:HdeA/HdeB family protein n=1 Tax=Thioclava litoralis TaxID=3076557 RepID=A0ABZ1DWP3_9RHOB|nr:hypothetical protein RPE78_08040 [Thioclava sp. FTW29]